MVLLLARFSRWTFRDDPANQAIVRRKGQTSEVATTASLQCETNHIFVAMAALTWRRKVEPDRVEYNHDRPFIPLAARPCVAVNRRDNAESPSG
ncbi:hypothetical protein [Bradyrhizobium sp. AS23.2]|uniref:hypothetical protein n=1 Tax=Bradyrhizobium sp. AS23.2 TaxID=1680155 RepID=UPI0014313B57|nr:hypothetical protein [Bradyrhizobium sp. AS23.2]